MKKLGAIVGNHYKKLLAILVFLLIWQLVVMLFGIKEFILPSPIRTFSYLFIPELAAQYDWPKHIGTTDRDDSRIFRHCRRWYFSGGFDDLVQRFKAYY